MTHSINDTTDLANGVKMPWLGLGVWQSQEGKEVEQAIIWALEHGYRSIDTATIYRNEAGVGRALKNSGLPREDIFLTTKVWNSDQGFETTLKAFETSLELLDTPYVDLYLIHWPVEGKFKDTWRALELLYREQKVRAIGVSNFLANLMVSDTMVRDKEREALQGSEQPGASAIAPQMRQPPPVRNVPRQ